MKVYSIGREVGCDIMINDNSDVISRRHATLNVSPTGKMTIVDLSHNGTYVNGIRISQNVPVPVTRKDNVSFAHVARLDWNLIPNTGANIMRWSMIGVLAALLIIGGIWGYNAWFSGGGDIDGIDSTTAVVDSTELKKEQEKMEQVEKQKQDSIKKDSLNKVHQKTAPKPVAKPKAKDTEKGKEEKKSEPKKEEPTTVRKRG